MSLQVWLPLNKNVIENKGLSDVTITNNGATFVNSGIESCYQIVGEQITFPTTNLQFMEMRPGKSFSIACWAKGAQDDGYWLFAANNWEIKFRATLISVYANNVGGSIISYTQTTTSTQWRHITFTWDGNSGNKLSLYVDGTLVGTSTFSSSPLNLSSYFKLINSGTRYLSDFRIYDHALSDKEVAELAKGLMFHLKLDNTDLYDCSGFGWPITKTGTLTEENDSPRYSKDIKFGGHNCCALTTNLGSEDIPRTFAFWYKPNSNNDSYNTIVSDASPHSGFWISCNTEGTGCWSYMNEFYVYGNSGQLLSNNIWYHMVWEYKGNNQYQWYLNGEPITTTSYRTPKAPIFTGQLNIGGAQCSDSATGAGKFDQYGSISDFRIYRTALTDEQVAELYKVAGSVDNQGKLHCYELNEGYYAYELNNYTLTGNNWIDTLIKPYDTGKNFEIVCSLIATYDSANNGYYTRIVDCTTNVSEYGVEILQDCADNGYAGRNSYALSLGNGDSNTQYFMYDNKEHTFIYRHYVGLYDSTSIDGVERTLNWEHIPTTAGTLKIGVGNFERSQIFLNDAGRRWHGKITHFHLRYF